MPIRGRKFWFATFLLAPLGLVISGNAQAGGKSLTRDVHVAKDGHSYQDVCPASAGRHCLSHRRVPDGFQPARGGPVQTFCSAPQQQGGASTTPPAGSMGPSDLLTAYNIPAGSAAHGQIVALVDMPDSNAYADLQTYRAAYNLPPLPLCPGGLPDGKTPCFAAVDENGAPNPTVKDCPGADGETGLDLDMVSAVCPDCSILLVQMTAASETDGPSDQDFVTCSQTAAKLGAVATSISFGGDEGGTQGGDPMGYTTPGHLVLAASGDSGYLSETQQGGGNSPSYPASSPDIIGVGGTTLTKGATYTEAVWQDRTGSGGSGCSIQYPMPAYQTAFGAAKFGSCQKRASVDVSASAEYSPGAGGGANAGGIAAFDAFDGFSQVVGTSAASPIVAAIFTRIGVAVPISKDFGFLYTNIAAFNDVTTGTNDTQGLCDDLMCKAAAGWDGPTGVGTPNATKLMALAMPVPPVMDAGTGTSSDEAGTPSSGSGDGGGGSTPPSSGSSGTGTNTTPDAGDGTGDPGDTTDPATGAGTGAGCSVATTSSTNPLGALFALIGAAAILGARRKRS